VSASNVVVTPATGVTGINVTGNLYASNAITTTNVFATRYYGDGGLLSNISSSATTQLFANLVVSNSVTTTNVFTNNVTATGIQTIAGLAGLTSLNVTGNVYASNAVTATTHYGNVVASNVVVTPATGVTGINVTGNVYASNAITTTNVFATRYYGDGGLLSNISSSATTQLFANLVVSNSVTTTNVFTNNVYVSNAVTTNNIFVISNTSLFGTSKFVLVSQSGASVYSDNGTSWASGTIATSNFQFMGVNLNTGRFVVAGQSVNIAYYSDNNGASWSTGTLPSASLWGPIVCTSSGRFVLIASLSTASAYSDNGSSWIAGGALPVSGDWQTVACNKSTGRFVAANAAIPSSTAYSDNGSSWIAGGALPSNTSWVAMAASYPVAITTGGYMGIGITNPAYQLDLSSDGARKLTTTAWLTGSDSRIKTDVESANLQTCYDVVKSVDLKYFKWNFPAGIVTDDKHSLGFIAQDIKRVFPNAVSESNSYGFEDFLSLNVDQINKALFGAVKYLAAKVEALEQGQSTVSEPAAPPS
jgi:hypothetical protein